MLLFAFMEKVLLIGSGGREHAIAEALAKDQNVDLYAAIAYRNPGILRLAKFFVSTESDINAVVDFARKENMDYCVVGPEKSLEAGIVDKLTQAGFPCASPSQGAARIETDKAFMRSLLEQYKIPGQISYLTTASLDDARTFCEKLNWRVAIKPVGLTSGKGVKVWGDHFQNPEEVCSYIEEILSQGLSGHRTIVIEELLEGQEFTVQFFTDGVTIIPTPAVQDHKRVYDDDRGPNSGGMGAYTDNNSLLPFLPKDEYDGACEIAQQVIDALREEGTPFKGVLYGQFMLTATGLKVVEFNARFGDPEAINILSLLQTKFSAICRAIIQGNLTPDIVQFQPLASVVRYVTPIGYGENPQQDKQVFIDEEGIAQTSSSLFFASCNLVGTSKEDLRKTVISTTRSRTLAISALGRDIFEAQKRTQEALKYITGDIFYRNDIATPESIEKRVRAMQDLRK